MGDQYYRLEESWPESEWLFEISTDEIRRINSVMPRSYYLSITSTHDGTRVELYEYVGEYSELKENDNAR